MSTEETLPPATGTPATKPAKQKTEAGKIIAAVEGFVVKEARTIAGLFAKEEPVVQQDIKDASGILQLIKTKSAAGGAVLVWLIKDKYPNFDDAKLQTVLSSGITSLGLAGSLIGPDLLTTVDNVAKYTGTLTGNAHNSFWNSLCNLITSELQPQLPWSRVVTLVEWVYQQFVKPKA